MTGQPQNPFANLPMSGQPQFGGQGGGGSTASASGERRVVNRFTPLEFSGTGMQLFGIGASWGGYESLVSTVEPDIQIVDVDLRGDRELVLRHGMRDAVPLVERSREEVLTYVRWLWGYDARLEGVDLESGKTLYTCPMAEGGDGEAAVDMSF